MINLYNQLTKIALPPANIFQRGLQKVKDTANLFRTTGGGKNELYNTFAEQGSEHAKGVVSSARKKFGKNLALGTAGIGAVGYGGYALGQDKKASYYELGHELLEKDAGMYATIKGALTAGKGARKANWDANATKGQKRLVSALKASALLGTGAAGGIATKNYLDDRKNEQDPQ